MFGTVNRIILIGNGFDLAHGLETSYKHFMNAFWAKKAERFKSHRLNGISETYSHLNKESEYKDDDISVNYIRARLNHSYNTKKLSEVGYEYFIKYITNILQQPIRDKYFINQFLEQITKKEEALKKWVDLEEEYYDALKECYHEKRKGGVITLNEEFLLVKNALESYLIDQSSKEIVKSEEINQKIHFPLERDKDFLRKDILNIGYTLFLNFNYTNTEKLYMTEEDKSIHIHGELGNPQNPIIFGYGDELDKIYPEIEQKNDNDLLQNIKSIKYLATRNYFELLRFIESNEYQIYVMGHSCGISDRTLLNTLFEHEHCLSIRVFYHDKGNGINNYDDLSISISRNFKDKALMRKRVINKEDCEPLVKMVKSHD